MEINYKSDKYFCLLISFRYQYPAKIAILANYCCHYVLQDQPAEQFKIVIPKLPVYFTVSSQITFSHAL